jgi:phosphohistidine phosphatase
MKSVLLFRHGKSDWSADFDKDYDRPLAGRGRKAARRMGALLTRTNQQPGHILCSPALRARTTLDIAAAEGSWTAPIEYDDRLYGAEAATVLHILQHVADEVESVMVVGHEPTMSDCVRMFTHASIRYPTAAICRIRFEVDQWRNVMDSDGELIWHIIPKLLR